MNLRDHDAPCEHGYIQPHGPIEPDAVDWCPGGAAVSINHTAAAVALGIQILRDSGYDAIAIVDAALGLTDD